MNHMFKCKALSVNSIASIKCLWVSFLENPHETSLVLQGIPRGLKGLLHMLNATVSPTTVDLCFLFLLCFFHFVLLRDQKNVSLGVFDECQILHIWPLNLYLLGSQLCHFLMFLLVFGVSSVLQVTDIRMQLKGRN